MARPAALFAQAQTIAEALMVLETAPAASIYAAPLVVLSADRAPRQVIGLHAGGRSLRLDPDEAILVAVALEHDRPFQGAQALASGLRAAVTITDLLALGARAQVLRSPTGNA
jgi:hypothetical protein